MSPLVLDTHALLWLVEGDPHLGPSARQRAEEAVEGEGLLVSAISFWEIAMLALRGRLHLAHPAPLWRQAVLGLGIVEVPVDGDIALTAVDLREAPRDPADRFILATAWLHQAVLVTADQALLAWPGDLERMDARH